MNIKIYEIQSLTELTCVANGAQYGFACNKTVFLFQKHMQSKEENVRTWTAIHYERDRFGLINGLMYLLEKENVEKIEMKDPSMNFENKKVLTMDILVKKGYSQESAQALMNDIANEALNGKPLKDLYNEKLRQIDEPSQNRVQSQKQERFEQQNNNLKVGYLREMKRNGGR